MRSKSQQIQYDSEYILTFDVDWAPDWIIDYVANTLIKKNVKATWFITHQSPAIDRLKEKKDIFELGIHPNLLNGSTHGKTEDEVLSHILEIIPEAKSMRTHGLYQSSSFLKKAAKEYGITTDVSLFLPHAAYLSPHQFKWAGTKLWRVPVFWEDDFEMDEEKPIWRFSSEILNIPGIKIFAFHPIHIILNTNSFEKYQQLKQKRPLQKWDQRFVEEHNNRNKGPRNLFLDLVDHLTNNGKRIQDLITEKRILYS